MAAPLTVEAQQAKKVWRIGVLSDASPQGSDGRIQAVGFAAVFQNSLRDLGYVEGQNLAIEWRNPEAKSNRLDALAAELVRLMVDVVVAPYPAAVLSAKKATRMIPIVMVHTPDPVQLVLVASLAHPGGNITGATSLSGDLSAKHLELLKELLPRVSRIAVLWNSDNPWHPVAMKGLADSARSSGVQLQSIQVRSPEGFGSAFLTMAKERAQAVLFLADPLTFIYRAQLAELAVKRRIPSMGGPSEWTRAGCLMSYWADTTDLYRRAASYVDRIFKGAKPGDLPIEQPTKFELAINLKTAKALSLTIPPSLLQRADQVIE
jgi:putative tryptophan/tyrosine transport system substrate-binding protein